VRELENLADRLAAESVELRALQDETLTIREIRESLGVGEATFYEYFPGGRSAVQRKA